MTINFAVNNITLKQFLLLLLFVLIYTACQNKSTSQETKLHVLTGKAQGTTYNIRYLGEGLANYQMQIDSIIKAIDLSLSTYVTNSTISEFNRQQKFTTNDEHFIRMLFESQSIQQISDGAFDPAVMPLVKAWGFGPEGPSIKQNQNIDSLLQLVNWDFDMSITTSSESTKSKTLVEIIKNSPVQFDFNAIAQGYTVDVLFEFLKQKDINNIMIELGGEVRATGVNDKQAKWKIGVDKPQDSGERSLQAVIEVDNKAVATSGNYRKYYEKEGKRYAHTINPKTGYPVEHNLLSTSVMAETCAQADAYATVFMVLGFEESILFLKKHPDLNLEAYFMQSDSTGNIQTHFTEGILPFITEIDSLTIP